MQAGGLDIFQILLESGPVVKLVLIILIACSVLSWAIIFQKKKELELIEKENENFNNLFLGTTSLVEINGKLSEYPQATVAKMFNQGHLELSKIKEELSSVGSESELRNYLKSDGLEAIERSLKKGANESQIIMENRLTTLASIGSISPFIGLFGTVWGIINSFSGLASGGGSIEAVAPGIAEALVATAVGLAAAIPAVWGFNRFNAQIMKTNFMMENFGQDFLNLIQRTVIKSKD